jgi:hypothetical protein
LDMPWLFEVVSCQVIGVKQLLHISQSLLATLRSILCASCSSTQFFQGTAGVLKIAKVVVGVVVGCRKWRWDDFC